MKTLLNKIDESQFMQIEKELLSLNPHSIEWIEDYLAPIKEMKLNWVNVGRHFQKRWAAYRNIPSESKNAL